MRSDWDVVLTGISNGFAKAINGMGRVLGVFARYGSDAPIGKIIQIEDDPWMTDEVKKIAIRAYVEECKYDREVEE